MVTNQLPMSQWIEFDNGWSLTMDGVWQWMEFDNRWSLTIDGVWQWMEFDNGWSLTMDGVWQWMEFDNRWSLTMDGVWQWMEFDNGWSLWRSCITCLIFRFSLFKGKQTLTFGYFLSGYIFFYLVLCPVICNSFPDRLSYSLFLLSIGTC